MVTVGPRNFRGQAPNPSIEATSTSKLRVLAAAPHVERWAPLTAARPFMRLVLRYMGPIALLAAGLLTSVVAVGQSSGLRAPTRIVYKCVVANKTVYSDEPCLGAERLDVQPTRGLNAASGKERVGQDVQRERSREQIAEAIRPVTGMSPKQSDTHARRVRLSSEAKSECGSLDVRLAEVESEAHAASAKARADLQRKLFTMRARYRELGC